MITAKISTGESHCVCKRGFLPIRHQYVINHVGSPVFGGPPSDFPISPVSEHRVCHKKVVVSAKFNVSLSSAVDLPDSKFAHDIFVSTVVVSQDGIEVSKDNNDVFL